MSYENKDLSFSLDGDFVLDENGDLALSEGFDCTVDDINILVKTQNGDTFFFSGADLEDLIGLPNVIEVANLGVGQITSALVANGVVAPEDLLVYAIPFEGRILYHISISTKEGETSYNYDIDLRSPME